MRALSELQYATLTALGVCLVFGYGLGAKMRWTFLGGAALGLAALTRGNGLLLWAGLTLVMPVYSAATRHTTKNDRSWLRREDWFDLAAMTAGFLITITPWAVRNYLVLGEWVALATSGGANMWLGHHPGSSGLLRPETRPSFPDPSSELAMSEYGLRKSLEYWLAAPIENLKTGARIVVEILKVDNGAMGLIEHGNQELPRWLEVSLWVGFNVVYYSLWLAGAVWGVARMTGRWVSRSKPGILIVVAIGYVLTYVPFIGWGRYKIPALPFLVAAASMIVVSMACPVEPSDAADRGERHSAGVGG